MKVQEFDKTELREFLSRELPGFNVKFAVLYGSMAADRGTAVSDIDLAVYCEPDDFLRLSGSLGGQYLGRRLDLTNLQTLAQIDRYEILANGQVVFLSSVQTSDVEELYRGVKLRAMREYLDFEVTRRRIMSDMFDRIRKGNYGRSGDEIQRT